MFPPFFVKDKVVFWQSMRSLAIAGIAFGALFWIPAIAFYAGSSVAVGRIVEVEARADSDGHTFYCPTFTFSTASGETQTVNSSDGGAESDYRVGNNVRVRYRPEHPTEARLDEFFSLWGIPVLAQGGSLFYLIVNSVVLRFARKNPPKSPHFL